MLHQYADNVNVSVTCFSGSVLHQYADNMNVSVTCFSGSVLHQYADNMNVSDMFQWQCVTSVC